MFSQKAEDTSPIPDFACMMDRMVTCYCAILLQCSKETLKIVDDFAIEESDIFSPDYLVDVGDVRSKAIEAMINRDKEIRRTTLGDDWAAQQQRQFVKRADVRRMTLI